MDHDAHPLDAFHPSVRAWFASRLGEPTPAQHEGWPAIRGGGHVLIAAPTGSGKTLAAFLWALDTLLREGAREAAAGRVFARETRIVYVSPLKALGNDVQKNLRGPLAELRELDPSLPEIEVQVRSGDTLARERAAMGKRPPHILVTTPETLYILLTSDGGRRMLSTVRTVIVDEIHAVAGTKRGSHLAISLERLDALAGSPQRIGLSATQQPIHETAKLLAGTSRESTIIDQGHLRDLDLRIELPGQPLAAVCSHEMWNEIYGRMADLIREHRTTLVFVNTRKLAERVAAQLTRLLGEGEVTCHHGSLSREHRLDAEERLKDGRLRALVATASLELGIDIGDVDLVVQVGSVRSIATVLQRVGRSGHGVGRRPKGRLFPLTRDELIESAAVCRAVGAGLLDRTRQSEKPLDILAQHIVSACVPEGWETGALFERIRGAWPYRHLAREEFDEIVRLHTGAGDPSGRAHRLALLHHDAVRGRLRATRRARQIALTSGGAIPDNADYRVEVEPGGTFVGTLNEDFAVESNAGDIFQLGNTSWRILKVEPGVVRVADAQGALPSVPFWLGEAPARTRELTGEVSAVRQHFAGAGPGAMDHDFPGCDDEGRHQIAEYLGAGARMLGAIPTERRFIAERFFDESGGMQLIIHAPVGSRVNRAWGLALRKRICRRFGFELQAAANDEAILLSLGPETSFPLEEIFQYLHPATARDLLVQALLAAPMFTARWRWNVSRALLVPRFNGGRRTPPPIARMRSDDLLARAFPEVVACGENLPPGDLPVPYDHPLVRQTIEDCLTEAMDVDRFLEVMKALHDGEIETLAVDTPEPSTLALGILNVNPYGFLDDAPLEERRAQAVAGRRGLEPRWADEIGELDPQAVARVREEAWPDPRDAEEMHEALQWMGYVTDEEAGAWSEWLESLRAEGRVVHDEGRWAAVDATRDPREVLRGRLEALGPVENDDPDALALFLALESEGHVLRVRLGGRAMWCERRLLARIHRYTLDRLRREIEPVPAADFIRFLTAWQRVHPDWRLDGPNGVAEALRQLAGFEAPVSAWESQLLPMRVRDYRREWLDDLTLSGEFAWGRLWGRGGAAARTMPVSFVPRADLEAWLAIAVRDELAGREAMTPASIPAGRRERANAGDETAPADDDLSAYARAVWRVLGRGGAMFPADLSRAAGLLPEHFEMGILELIGQGLVTCDSFTGMRQLALPAHKRRGPLQGTGRWSRFREAPDALVAAGGEAGVNGATGVAAATPDAVFYTRRLLQRWGVIFPRLLTRERGGLPWRDIVRAARRLEYQGEIRGGRFVGGFSGEQFALPEAVALLRKLRRDRDAADAGDGDNSPALTIWAADPLNVRGILTPDERVPSTHRRRVLLG